MNSSSRDHSNSIHFGPVRAIIAIAREFDKVARDADVSIAQYRLLLYLKDGPRRAGEVAATSLVTKATISGHIAALRDKGWISVETEAFDRRVTRLMLSESGRSAMETFETKLLECLGDLVEEKDREKMIRDLSDLYSALSATRETRYLDFETPNYRFLHPSGTE